MFNHTDGMHEIFDKYTQTTGWNCELAIIM